MKVSKECKELPELLKEINLRRFVWRLLHAWYKAKTDNVRLRKFWTDEQAVLQAFDRDFPNDHGPPPNVMAQRPTLPHPPLAVMTTKEQRRPPPPPTTTSTPTPTATTSAKRPAPVEHESPSRPSPVPVEHRSPVLPAPRPKPVPVKRQN
jgi:hypothetical protein